LRFGSLAGPVRRVHCPVAEAGEPHQFLEPDLRRVETVALCAGIGEH
jgi:hypothetical protein